MAQMQIRQAQLEQRVLHLEAETLRLTREAAHPPLQPIIGREDVDGLAAHVLGKIQTQIAEEVSACARWYRETYDEPWKTRVQTQLMDLLRLDTEAEPELPGTSLIMSAPRGTTDPRPHLPRESSSTDAEPEPRVRVKRPVRREAGAAPEHGHEATPGRSAAF